MRVQWTGCHGQERHGGERLWMRMQWTGCHDVERYGGDRAGLEIRQIILVQRTNRSKRSLLRATIDLS